MMTFSVLWILLAAMVTVVAMMRRGTPVGAHVPASASKEVQARQSGKALSVVAILYSLILIAGFLYIGWQTAVH